LPAQKGIGKCAMGHTGSYGYPTRPLRPYNFCPQCGTRMLWACARCRASMPDDPAELLVAMYCRDCGAPYFDEANGKNIPPGPGAAK
jgi:hypothetical protein